MQAKLRHYNRATLLTILTVGFAGFQSFMLHILTTDNAHKILSIYFFIELFILILTISTGLKNRLFATIYFLTFIIEMTLFFINERPISPDILIMILIGALRIYIFYWLTRQLTKGEQVDV